MERFAIGAIIASLLCAGPALSHVSLEVPEVAPGSTYKAVLRIGHGCDGAAMTRLRVTLPEGFYNAKPMPKPGWVLETVKGDYAMPFDNHGEEMTQGTREVIWSGGELADDWYDEFTIRGSIGKDLPPGSVLYFPTVQDCGKASAAWINVTGNPDAPDPAPVLKLTEAKGAHEHAHAAGPGDGAVVLGDLSITGAFSRATPPGAPVAGGFMTIHNAGGDDRLVSAHAAVAARTEIHEMTMQGDVMRMRALPEGLAIPAGATVELKPGGLHLMFMEPNQPFAEGATVPVTLTFEKAGEVTVPLAVGPMGAGKGGGHDGH